VARLPALLPAIALLTGASFPAQAALPSAAADQRSRLCERLYAVTWRLDFDASGQVVRVTLEVIIDPSNGRTPEEAASRPIQLDLPAVYVAAAEAFLRQLPRQPDASNPAWTFTLYDPAQPTQANPRCGRAPETA
jgi:hypothetical protein